jgi:mercuric reductase
MMGAGEDPLDLAVLPEVIFTDPQVARVGLTEEEAREKGYSPVARTLPFDKVPRALVNFDTRGWIRMVADERTGQLLGCTVLAPEGGEVVQSAAMALARGLTVQEIGRMFFPYLTMVESLKLCAQSFSKDVGRLSCCAG